EETRPHVHAERPAERLNATPWVQSLHLAERHEEHAPLMKAHDLGEAGVLVDQTGYTTQFAEPHVETRGFDHQAHDPGDPPQVGKPGEIGDAASEIVKHGYRSAGDRYARAPYRFSHR